MNRRSLFARAAGALAGIVCLGPLRSTPAKSSQVDDQKRIHIGPDCYIRDAKFVDREISADGSVLFNNCHFLRCRFVSPIAGVECSFEGCSGELPRGGTNFIYGWNSHGELYAPVEDSGHNHAFGMHGIGSHTHTFNPDPLPHGPAYIPIPR